MIDSALAVRDYTASEVEPLLRAQMQVLAFLGREIESETERRAFVTAARHSLRVR
jgi:hypothetical protein